MEYRRENIGGTNFNHPKILYKYRDWNNEYHKRILTENKIYLSSPCQFEDKYDCNLTEIFPPKSELYDCFLKIANINYPNMSRREKREFARYWSQHSPLAHPDERSKIVTEYTQEFNDRFGVLSMTADFNNNAMWEKYANQHKGLCIGFDSEMLFERVGGGGKVEYVNHLPVIEFLKDDVKLWHIKNIFFKEDKWSFEKEYRLHKMWEDKATDDERNIELPQSCIREVILGKDMPPQDKEEIQEIIKNKYPHAKIIEEVCPI